MPQFTALQGLCQKKFDMIGRTETFDEDVANLMELLGYKVTWIVLTNV